MTHSIPGNPPFNPDPRMPAHLPDRPFTDNHLRIWSHHLVSKAPNAFWVMSDDWSRALFLSPAIFTITGYHPKDFTDDASLWIQIMHADDREQVLEHFKAHHGKQSEQVYRIIHKDRSIRWIRDLTFPIHDTAGNLVVLAGICEDVTRAREMEHAQKQSDRRFRTLFEQTLDSVFVFTPQGKIVDINASACQRLGYSREEMLSFQLQDLDPEFPTQDDGSPHWPGPTYGAPQVFESTHRRKDGSTFPVEISVALVDLGTDQSILAIARDISDRKAAEERLRLAENMRTLGRLASRVGHDFNNQLSGILAFAELLRDALRGHPSELYAKKIFEGTQRATEISRQLLEYGRRGKRENVRIQLHDLIRQTVDHLDKSLSRDHRVITHFDATNPSCQGDPVQLGNAFLNILINGLEAMDSPGTLLIRTQHVDLMDTIQPSTREKPPYTLITFSDTGCGMDSQTVKHVFEPYYTAKPEGHGVGMGMAAAFNAIYDHQGTISIQSEQGEGTTVLVWLPVL